MRPRLIVALSRAGRAGVARRCELGRYRGLVLGRVAPEITAAAIQSAAAPRPPVPPGSRTSRPPPRQPVAPRPRPPGKAFCGPRRAAKHHCRRRAAGGEITHRGDGGRRHSPRHWPSTLERAAIRLRRCACWRRGGIRTDSGPAPSAVRPSATPTAPRLRGSPSGRGRYGRRGSCPRGSPRRLPLESRSRRRSRGHGLPADRRRQPDRPGHGAPTPPAAGRMRLHPGLDELTHAVVSR
jgi:hypothetical protein